jgi:predicted RNA polymerase sigma factor
VRHALPEQEAITRVHHEEWARVVAGLARRFGDLDVAEEAAAEAFAVAVERWPRDGVPPDPGGWLTTPATRKAIDRLRRESQRDTKHQAARMLHDDTPPEPTGPVEDDRLADTLDGYHAFHVARAELLRRQGHRSDSRAADDRAIDLAGNPAERAHLTR